jgi:hypothetical protein
MFNSLNVIVMKNKTNSLQPFYQETLAYLRSKSDQELIDCFNREVNCSRSGSWTSNRCVYLIALEKAFKERKLLLDPTVFRRCSLHLNRKLRLEGNKVIAYNDLEEILETKTKIL